MKKSVVPRVVALAALWALGLGTSAQAQTAFAINSAGTGLISFDLATPGTVTTVGSFSGAVTSLNAIDFRPGNNLLYGYNSASNSLVTIDVGTGVTTFVVNPSIGAPGAVVGMDFNPAADRLRLTNLADINLRVNVGTGLSLNDGTLAYAAGDPNFGTNPNISETAYTNNDTDGLTGTTLFYIDSTLNTLVSTTNPNGGVLNTIGGLGVDPAAVLGFDILTNGAGVNFAYGLFDIGGGVTNLYSINLGTGAASLVGNFGAAGPLGFAIAPVPEPGTIAMMGAALGGWALIRRFRSRKAA